jgi:hypothetical protein
MPKHAAKGARRRCAARSGIVCGRDEAGARAGFGSGVVKPEQPRHRPAKSWAKEGVGHGPGDRSTRTRRCKRRPLLATRADRHLTVSGDAADLRAREDLDVLDRAATLCTPTSDCGCPSSCAVFRPQQSRSQGTLQYCIRIPKTYSIFLWQRLHLAAVSPFLRRVAASSADAVRAGPSASNWLIPKGFLCGRRAGDARQASPRWRRTASRKAAIEMGLEM